MAGDDVYALQGRLLDLGFRVGRLDGYFGPETEAGVREFQRNFGIPPDGTCGPATLKALTRLSPMVKGGAPNALRAQERIREAGPHLGGKTVVIDVGRGHNLPARLRIRLRRGPARPRAARGGPAGRHRRPGVPDHTALGRRPRARRPTGPPSPTAPAPTCSSPWRSTPPPTPTRAASRRTSSATPTATPGPRSASASPAWCSARSSRAATSSTCAPTPRPGTCCATPGCRPSGSTRATSPTPVTTPACATRSSATCSPRPSWSRCSASTSAPRSTPTPACCGSARSATRFQGASASVLTRCVAAPVPATVRRRGRVPGPLARRPHPSSVSRPRSSSSRIESVVRRSIRIRGLTACARWVEKPTASRKSAGTTHWPVRPRVSPNASTALTAAAPDQVLGHPLHHHPAQSPAAVLGRDVRGGRGSPRRR